MVWNFKLRNSNFWLQKIFKLSFHRCTEMDIVHGKSLFNMKLILSPNCNICYEIYTIHVYIIDFPYAAVFKYFWRNLIFLWQQQIENANHLTTKDVISVCYVINNTVLNYYLLLGKCFIH